MSNPEQMPCGESGERWKGLRAGKLIVGLVQELTDTCTACLAGFADYLQVPVAQPQEPQATDIWWNSACAQPSGHPVGVAWNPALLNVEFHFQDRVVRVRSVQLQDQETRVKIFKWVEAMGPGQSNQGSNSCNV